MVNSNYEIGTYKYKISDLVKGVSNCKSLALYWCITGLCSMGESAANKSYFPSRWTTKWFYFWTQAMFLQESETNTSLRPVSG